MGDQLGAIGGNNARTLTSAISDCNGRRGQGAAVFLSRLRTLAILPHCLAECRRYHSVLSARRCLSAGQRRV